MRRESVLALLIALVIVGSVIAAVASPDVFAEPEPPDIRPGRVDIQEVTISPGAVGGSTATLSVTTWLSHRGGRSENVTVRVRAVALDSGLVETEQVTEVPPIEGDREEPVTINVSVPREGGYRIETLVYQDGRRIETGTKEVRGVGTLEPDYAATDVEFHRFGMTGADLPAIQYSIEGAANNRTTLSISAYLTNRGDTPSGDLRVEYIVRQADSNIVAARTSKTVGAIRPGRTATPSVEVTIPDNYNYYLDAILWKDGVIVGTARSAANLDPTERIETNVTVRDVGLEVGDFDREAEPTPREVERTVLAERTGTPGQPGFGLAIAILSLLAVGLLTYLRRRNQ